MEYPDKHCVPEICHAVYVRILSDEEISHVKRNPATSFTHYMTTQIKVPYLLFMCTQVWLLLSLNLTKGVAIWQDVKSGMRNGMEHGMEYGMCSVCLLEDNYVITPTFKGISDYPLTICSQIA